MHILSDESTQLLVGLAAGTIFKFTALRWLGSKRKEYIGTVSKVYIYPVKSVRELPGLTEATITKHGLKFEGVGDRHWLVTKNGDMYTMKQSARLTLITSKIEGKNLRLDGPDMPPLILPLYPNIQSEMVKSVTVKNTPLPALECGDDAADWVSKVLQQPGLRLNYSAPSLSKRLSKTVKKDWPTKIQPQDEIAFQDFVHCMIMTESSMVALNKRLKKPVSVIAFRPNLMIDGCPAFDEDTWEEVFIGDKVHLRYVDKCTRCVITCIDPETAVRDKEEQPLKELRTFRCMDPYGPKPCMGVHTCVEVEGQIKVGDPVYVIRK